MSSRLFEPIAIGEVKLPNRLVVAPMCQYSASDGSATDWHLQHLSQLAYSGAGLVMVEATAVERRGRITHACLGLYSDDNEAALERALYPARRLAGPTRFGIQLAHAGRKASTHRPWQGGAPLGPAEDPWQTVSSSATPFGEGWHVPHALTSAEIDAIVAAFVQSAQRAVRLGFDVIEIHSAHGYLLHEFLSPLVNTRTDDYGGSLENRMRVPLAVIRAVRAATPTSVAVGLRISGTDWVEGGWDVAQSIAYVRAAKELGIAYVCVSSGGIRAKVTVPAAPG
jgi:2,4-dienoyl-CoA reductase-like NADH-dependent reductase (Old Yellow Enzyme family)